jgi:nucleoside-diphosphate-sugar epimerase
VLDRLIFEHGEAIAPMFEQPRFSFVLGDFRDPEKVEEALDGITDVALLGGLVGDPITKTYPELSAAINVDGCTAILDALDGRGIDRLVFTSTCSNYGLRTTDDLATEESDLAPLSLYAEHKVEIEKRILARAKSADYTPTVLRISTAYGLSPRMRFDLTIAEFTVTMATGDELVVYDADTWRPYCHVEDISKAVVTVLEAPADQVRGEVFNTGHSDENYTKRMVVDVVQERLGGQGRVEFMEGGVDPRNYRVSFEKIARVLGYEPDYRVPDFVDSLVTAVESGVYRDYAERPDFFTNHRIGDRYLAESGIEEGG